MSWNCRYHVDISKLYPLQIESILVPFKYGEKIYLQYDQTWITIRNLRKNPIYTGLRKPHSHIGMTMRLKLYDKFFAPYLLDFKKETRCNLQKSPTKSMRPGIRIWTLISNEKYSKNGLYKIVKRRSGIFIIEVGENSVNYLKIIQPNKFQVKSLLFFSSLLDNQFLLVGRRCSDRTNRIERWRDFF